MVTYCGPEAVFTMKRAAVARFRIDLPAGSKADAIELRLVVEGAEPVVLGRLALPRNAAS